MLSKYTIALLGPATLLFLALDVPSRFWFRRAAPYLAVALSVVLFSPVIWWNAVHHWASFAFQTTGRTRVRRHFALHELLGTIFGVLTPVGVWLAALALFERVSPDRPGDAPAEFGPARRRLFTRVFTLVPLSVFVLFSLTHRVKLNWTGPLWLAAVPALAAALVPGTGDAASRPRGGRALRLAWSTTVAVCALLYALTLQHLAFGLPGVKYSRNTELLPVGWPELARALERQKAELEHGNPGPVYIVGMDRNFIASEVSFYQSDQSKGVRETTGSHLFEGGSLMYQYWFPPARLEGATLLLVGFRREELQTRRVDDHSLHADPIITHSLTYRGRTIRPYYTQVAYGYRSATPAPR